MTETVTGPLGAEGRYWDALHEGHLELQRCKGCGKWNWPAVWRCGECGSWEHEWVKQPMQGTVFTWTRTHHRFGGTESLPLPYTTALVALSSAPVRLIGIVDGDEDKLRIGAKATGRVDRTSFGGGQIPSIRWSIS